MKCLFIFSDAALSENYFAGGASRYVQAFQALILLGHEVHVLRLLSKEREEAIRRFELELSSEDIRNRNLARAWTDVTFEYPLRFRNRLEGVRKGLVSPLEFAFPVISILQNTFCDLIRDIDPDFIVAEMYPAGAVLAAMKPRIPWIFGHHDWWYRLRQNRLERAGVRTIGSRFTQWVLRRAEEEVVRRSSAVITASITEMNEMRRLKASNCVTVPSTYVPVPWPSPDALPQDMRIVHLGSLGRSSVNVEPLNSYIEQVAPQLPKDWEFVVIGAVDTAPAELLANLQGSGAKVLGHVQDLRTVLRPFDVAIVPYQHNTGERTRVAQLFNHAQVVLTIDEAVKGSPYIRPGENCLVAASLSEFPEQLRHLAASPALRRQIGLAAKETFERELTLHAQLPKFEHIIDLAIQNNSSK